MAWNNRDIEPRREYTEQLIGLFFIPVYLIGLTVVMHLSGIHTWGFDDGSPGYILGGFLITAGLATVSFFGTLLLVGLWYLSHAIGEVVCGLLQAVGLDPRPNPRERGY